MAPIPQGKPLDFLLQGQGLEVLIDDEPEASSTPASAKEPPRFGVVAMCKHVSEVDVETWLTFHSEHLGAERFYLRIEDSEY